MNEIMSVKSISNQTIGICNSSTFSYPYRLFCVTRFTKVQLIQHNDQGLLSA